MKFFLSFFFLLFSNLCVYSQTQQGYVKTLGRPDKKGEPLSGVFVRIKGEYNPVLSKEDGTFTLLLTGKKNGEAYTLQEVQKKGYELNETGVIGRQYAYSDKVPLTIVMVSSVQLRADKLRIENNAYKVAEKNYKANLEFLENQKTDNAITEEQYRKELLELQDKFEKYQLLIDGLAEHYALVDYDELNDKEREVNICIENGELERADSLVKTMFNPIDVLKRNKEALAQLNQQITGANTIIDKANEDMEAVLKQQEKDANYLYQLYTVALSRFDNDKAGQYIETRAELDTTNILWQMDAGHFEGHIAKYDKALFHFHRVLKNIEKNNSSLETLVICYEKIADIYREKRNYTLSKNYYEKALELRCNEGGGNSHYLASLYIGLALLYAEKQEYDKASDYYLRSANIYSSTSERPNNDYAILLLSMGESLCKLGDYNNATESIKLALSILFENKGNGSNIAAAFSLLSSISRLQGNFNEAIDLSNKALNLSHKFFGENHPLVSEIYSGLGLIYSDKGEYTKALEYHKKSLAINKNFFGEHSSNVGSNYANIAICYANEKQYNKAIENFRQALKNMSDTYGENHIDIARVYENMGQMYDIKTDYVSALSCYLKALPIYEKILGVTHQDVTNICNLIAYSYININSPTEALYYYKKALNISRKLYKESNQMIEIGYNNLYHTYMRIISQDENTPYIQEYRDFLSEVAFVGTVVDNYPAYSKGLRGDYFLLEYNDWHQDCLISLFEYIEYQRGKRKYLVLLKNDRTSTSTFEDVAGMQFHIVFVGKDVKKRINDIYEQWKKH